MADDEATQHRALRAMGITLLGIVLSVGVSVGFGIEGRWWLRLIAGLTTVAVLIAVIKVGTSQGERGAIARLADWITGEHEGRR